MSYEITKGMKSFGPIGLLKASDKKKELIICQLNTFKKIFHTLNKNISASIITGFGHDKISKKIPNDVHKIYNIDFSHKNQGHAFKLLLENIDHHSYDGIFISSQNILMKSYLPSFNFDKSYIFINKLSKKNIEDYVGIVLNNDDLVDYMFYNIGDCAWSGMCYISKKDIEIIKNNQNCLYDNMFLFEVINTTISKHQIKYSIQNIENKTISHIHGVKDKQKIREYIL